MKCITLTGHDLKKFWDDPNIWGDQDWFYEDTYFTVNGEEASELDVETLKDSDKVTVDGGCLCYQGSDPRFMGYTKELDKTLAEWLKAQKRMTLVIEFNRDQEPYVRSTLQVVDGLEVV